ncbi:SGNH/GDSL hydrolase family protein [Roseateles sp.]|uniref:SGNH/GDSL hydrolase family protein n=1 Tax=Roseateles sp. TaxID=1971397 RepID=UPI0025E7CFEF|nr:SGNH/GDSL hydrolase family protein [Roseateles sp.]MBV8036254.1 SGNH/GDSL hydrolase family protein [Roseateles sp.]
MRQSFLRRWVRPLVLLAAGLGLAALARAQPYSNLFVFGDSLSDVGNDLVVTGGAVPSTSYYSNGSIVGRFTNGLSYADHLAAGLGLSLSPSVLGGTDYAYGGARTGYMAAGLPASALSFNQQIGAFTAGHAQADAGALFVLWIGANDMSDAIGAAAQGNPGAVGAAISQSMQSIGGAIQGLSSLGATHFLVANLPDLSLIPAVNSRGSAGLSALAQGASQAFNAALAGTLAQPAFSALDIRQFDVYAAHTAITANPSAYGFSNVTGACYTGDVGGQALPGGPAPSVCGNPDAYLYWDYEHPTAALHAVLGAQALAVAVPEPAQALLLALGLAVLAGVRRARRRR